MHIGRAFGIALFCAVIAWGAAARATLPSAACKSGAEECRAAYDAFEKCRKGKNGSHEACKTQRELTDKKCKKTDSICTTDGSRAPPR